MINVEESLINKLMSRCAATRENLVKMLAWMPMSPAQFRVRLAQPSVGKWLFHLRYAKEAPKSCEMASRVQKGPSRSGNPVQALARTISRSKWEPRRGTSYIQRMLHWKLNFIECRLSIWNVDFLQACFYRKLTLNDIESRHSI